MKRAVAGRGAPALRLVRVPPLPWRWRPATARGRAAPRPAPPSRLAADPIRLGCTQRCDFGQVVEPAPQSLTPPAAIFADGSNRRKAAATPAAASASRLPRQTRRGTPRAQVAFHSRYAGTHRTSGTTAGILDQSRWRALEDMKKGMRRIGFGREGQTYCRTIGPACAARRPVSASNREESQTMFLISSAHCAAGRISQIPHISPSLGQPGLTSAQIRPRLASVTQHWRLLRSTLGGQQIPLIVSRSPCRPTHRPRCPCTCAVHLSSQHLLAVFPSHLAVRDESQPLRTLTWAHVTAGIALGPRRLAWRWPSAGR